MKIDIDGLTQLQIEEEFDSSKAYEAIQGEVLEYADKIKEYLPTIHKVVSKYAEAEEWEIELTMILLLEIIGNTKSGVYTKDGSRDIPLDTFVKTLYKGREFSEMFSTARFDIAMDLIAEFDGILFDIVKRHKQMEDGQYATFTYINSAIHFEEQTNLLAKYSRFRLPLIEEPKQWRLNENGGYHLFQRKITTKRGCNQSSDKVFGAINKLQSQPWIHSQDEDLELNYNYEQFIASNNSERDAEAKARMLQMSCEQTYSTIEDRTIYFEYRYDFRGRMYSTGYDINPQGNAIKKAGLRPKLF